MVLLFAKVAVRLIVWVDVPKSAKRYSARASQWWPSAVSRPPPMVQPSFVAAFAITGGEGLNLLRQGALPQVEITSSCCHAAPPLANSSVAGVTRKPRRARRLASHVVFTTRESAASWKVPKAGDTG